MYLVSASESPCLVKKERAVIASETIPQRGNILTEPQAVEADVADFVGCRSTDPTRSDDQVGSKIVKVVPTPFSLSALILPS